MNEDTNNELDASSCTEIDTSSILDDQEQTTTPAVEVNPDDTGFQLISPRKAAREFTQVKVTPTKTTNKFSLLVDENNQEAAQRSVPEINLKIVANVIQILKEISQQFTKTENRLRRGFIGIKADSEENREKTIKFLKQKNLEFVLSEAYEDRPLKVVIRNLPINMEISEITQCWEEKGYQIERASQMKNYIEKTILPLFLIDVKKTGNYANIFNERQACYFRVKVVPYSKRKKATICFNCSGFFHSARNCDMHPRCIKCNGQHATRDCSMKEIIQEPTCINCGEKGHLAAWKGCKA
ncbi:hypothetical protein AVEN_249338-1 [Araneus ventricosus]|uniref:CCHC-type domain-containing protein n=1 Tax=Araneus ventricosus TaxID=182803 RepID=A0A4Y2K330_ARAVE|nr:hypothetical protein AVEN_249338-1 [Araneus ventricosus]